MPITLQAYFFALFSLSHQKSFESLLLQKHLDAPGNIVIAKEADSPTRRQQLVRLASAAKMDGALVVVQISHAGRQTPITINPTPFASSDVQLTKVIRGRKFGVPVPLSEEQVRIEVVERFAYAASVIYEAGNK